MNLRTQQLVLAFLLIIGYIAIGLCGEVGKMINGLLGNFAVGWLVMDIAIAIIKE